MIAVDFAVGPSYSVVISGDTDADDTSEMLEALRIQYLPNIISIHRATESYPPKIDEFVNYIEWFDKVENKAAAYVCINKTCKPPTIDRTKMLEYINSK